MIIKITFDNGEEYNKEEFKKDKSRMFDSIRCKESKHFGECNCIDCECYRCPLDNGDICMCSCNDSFQVIERVYKWAKEHPFVTNREKLKEVFNVNLDEYTELYLSCLKEHINDDFTVKQEWVNQNINKWLDSEYKEPGSDEDSVQ